MHRAVDVNHSFVICCSVHHLLAQCEQKGNPMKRISICIILAALVVLTAPRVTSAQMPMSPTDHISFGVIVDTGMVIVDSQFDAHQSAVSTPMFKTHGQLRRIYGDVISGLPTRDHTASPQSYPNQSITIRWPFGSQPMSLWNGTTGDRTAGGSIPNYCGDQRQQISSHSLGDYYARDLSRKDGNTAYQAIYAGRGGYIIKAGPDGCYGNSVLLWVPGENVLLRYSHMLGFPAMIGSRMSIPEGTLIGWIGRSGCGSFAYHLHLVAYKGLPYMSSGQICSGSRYACKIYFR